MKTIPIIAIVLVWHCVVCEETIEQPLEDLSSVGIAICPQCGDDMRLGDYVRVSEV